MTIHTVKDGERIKDIACKYGVDEGIIRRNNGIDQGEAAVGEELIILVPTRTHRLSDGDTPERLALRYNVRICDLLCINPRLSSGGYRTGDVIAIKYEPRSYGTAPSNGCVFGGASIDMLNGCMPYLTYVTLAAGVVDRGGVGFIFDHTRMLDVIKENGRIPLLRIYSRCDSDDFCKEGFTDLIIDRMIEAAMHHGYRGIVLAGEYPKCADFLVRLRSKMIGCDLILITEMDESSPYELSEYADGSILSYAKYTSDADISFKDGEQRVLSTFATGAESSKTFVDLPSLALCDKGFTDIGAALYTARRSGAEIKLNEDTLISEFTSRRSGRCRFTSLQNIKAVLELMNEYGFMGISFDIMRTPMSMLMLYTAMYKSATLPVTKSIGGCLRE